MASPSQSPEPSSEDTPSERKISSSPTTSAPTAHGDTPEIIQTWDIAVGPSRSGVATWTAEDGNILLRMTFHPEDKLVGVNSQVNQKYVREETFDMPTTPSAIRVTFHANGFTISTIASIYTLIGVSDHVNIRENVDMHSNLVGTCTRGEVISADDVQLFRGVVERYRLVDGRGWVSRHYYIPHNESIGDEVLQISSHKLSSSNNPSEQIILHESERDFFSRIGSTLTMKLPDGWYALPFDTARETTHSDNEVTPSTDAVVQQKESVGGNSNKVFGFQQSLDVTPAMGKCATRRIKLSGRNKNFPRSERSSSSEDTVTHLADELNNLISSSMATMTNTDYNRRREKLLLDYCSF